MHYTGQVYRHPIEGYTSLLEVTARCSHNKCSFCTMYRETPFIMSTEKLVVIGELINQYFPNIETITCYASIKSLKNKSVDDLKRLKSLGYRSSCGIRVGI